LGRAAGCQQDLARLKHELSRVAGSLSRTTTWPVRGGSSVRMATRLAGRHSQMPEARDCRRDVTGTTRNAHASRMVRQEPSCAYEIHRSICRNSPAKPCLTYGVVGYGYVSVLALLPAMSVPRGAR
jgi:hypothetical protein